MVAKKQLPASQRNLGLNPYHITDRCMTRTNHNFSKYFSSVNRANDGYLIGLKKEGNNKPNRMLGKSLSRTILPYFHCF